MVVALDVIRGSSAKYVTVNLNRQLAAELTERAGPLDLELNIIEDDAQNLRGHFDVGTFDCICFHHAMNDILQTAVATSRGMDTRTIDWWPTERTMIEWMAEEHQAHGLEKVGLPELRAILELSAEVLRPGGIMVFDHWTWEHHLGLDWFPGELFTVLIPMAREVALSLSTPLVEITPEGLDGQWWMVLKRQLQG